MPGRKLLSKINFKLSQLIFQWAKIVVSLERAVSQKDAHNYLQEYSIKLGPGDDPNNPASEQRGVMVIKSKSKTRAKQRKGAVANWKVIKLDHSDSDSESNGRLVFYFIINESSYRNQACGKSDDKRIKKTWNDRRRTSFHYVGKNFFFNSSTSSNKVRSIQLNNMYIYIYIQLKNYGI